MIKAARTAEKRTGNGTESGTANGAVKSASALALARKVLSIEADAVRALIERLDERFLEALALILHRKGRVVVSGIGKSGHIARKIASTLASTGTPAYFVHPAEASHGDLGMIDSGDIFIAISYSGESAELREILPLVKRRGAKLIAITGKTDSTLAREADVNLDAAVAHEACPHNLAPTASTTAALALGDALAIALLDARGFSAADFASSHPRGALPGQALSAQALLHVDAVMRSGNELPQVPAGSSVRQAIQEMTRGKMGMTAVLDATGRVKGVFTDGDLRRALQKDTDIDGRRVDEVMTSHPKTIGGRMLAAEAVHLMEAHKVNQVLVVDAQDRLVGALNMHDLFRAKVV
jgi:arabinose-5-phosphate isomerase